VDVHLRRKINRIIYTEIIDGWVECKNLKTPVKRSHVNNLIRKAQDLRKGCEDEIESWYADILMICSTSGFDVDAVRIGDEHGIYLVHYTGGKYKFAGGDAGRASRS